jgi:hypothetical protein
VDRLNIALTKCFSATRRCFEDLTLRNENVLIAKFVTQCIEALAKLFKRDFFPFFLRKLLSDIQPSNPLKSWNAPNIDVLIPCHPKDLLNLQIVLEGVKRNVMNPVHSIRLVTTKSGVARMKQEFPHLTVECEDQYLSTPLLEFISVNVPPSRRGWIVQQVIKINGSLSSDTIATLVLDSDTVLLRPKTYLDARGRQSLSFAYEYHQPYKEHQVLTFGGRNHPMSFVTHYQLFYKPLLLEIFPCSEKSLINWLENGNYTLGSAVSEYDSYGEWVYLNKRKYAALSKWGNQSISIGLENFASYQELKDSYPKFSSISAHSYLK